MPLRRALAWAVVLATLVAVFDAYLQPGLMRDVADFLWSCF